MNAAPKTEKKSMRVVLGQRLPQRLEPLAVARGRRRRVVRRAWGGVF